jgi:TolB-like protein/cytochrome c-type biogenesis protein CcmH/NrfG
LYLIGAWIVLQVANVTFAPLGVPDWVNTLLIWVSIIGFPVTIVLGWRYEIGPEGLVLTRPRTGADDAADLSLQRSDYLILTLVVVVVSAAAYGLVARFSGTTGDAGRRASTLQNTIAVLPFINMSTSADDAPLGDGISDELRDQLSQVPGMRVVARGSSVVFRDQDLDVRSISSDLGAEFLLMGRLTRTSVSVELIEGPTGIRVWSKPFERRTGLLSIQEEIIAQLVAELAPGAQAAAPATSNVSAHELLLVARQLDQEVQEQTIVDEPKLLRAIELYRKAIELDPSSALAHSRLGAALLYANEVDAAQPEIFAALTLDPNLSEIHYTQALYYLREGLPGVGAFYKRALELNPNNTEAVGAYALWLWGHENVTAAGDLFRRAIDLDPLSLARYESLAEYIGTTGRKQEGLELAARIEQRFPNARGYRALARLHELLGDLDVGIAWGLKALELQPNDVETSWLIAELYTRIGDFETALVYEPEPGISQLFWQRRYQELIDLAEIKVIEEPQNVNVWYMLGFAYHAMGEHVLAVNAIEVTQVADANSEARLAADSQAVLTMGNAMNALGDTERAQALVKPELTIAQMQVETGMGSSWWPNTFLACTLSLMERDADALIALERMKDSMGLPWMPLLRDYRCFRKFENDPRYQSVIASFEQREADLRARLPETLRRFQSAR